MPLLHPRVVSNASFLIGLLSLPAIPKPSFDEPSRDLSATGSPRLFSNAVRGLGGRRRLRVARLQPRARYAQHVLQRRCTARRPGRGAAMDLAPRARVLGPRRRPRASGSGRALGFGPAHRVCAWAGHRVVPERSPRPRAGFRVDAAPSGAVENGPLCLVLSLGCSAEVLPSGRDALLTPGERGHPPLHGSRGLGCRGRVLPASLLLEHDRLVIEVDDRDAAYPIHVDPWIAVEEPKPGEQRGERR